LPTQSQALWLVAQAHTQPKPAKELAFPTAPQTETDLPRHTKPTLRQNQ